MVRLLLIDNYDSFTYNIVDYLRRLNVCFQVVKTDKLNLEHVDYYTHIIFSPGGGLPAEYPAMFDVLENYHKTKSILGICLGHQAINLFFGGEIFNINPVHGQGIKIKKVTNSRIFNGLPLYFEVGLYHSWAVDIRYLPENLQVTAISDNGIVMGISHKYFDIHGVQFHPESYVTEYGLDILRNFLKPLSERT